jgi:glucose/mannose-6-phosphate isomerase
MADELAALNLDDPSTYATLDPSNMLARVLEIDRQMADAWRLASAFEAPARYRDAQSVVVLGMGGSAIGGDLARSYAADKASVPILVSREYDLPAWIGPGTVVIAASYSGGTEETLSATSQALERGALVLAVTTGGKLGDLARQRGFPLVTFAYPAQPRAAIGYSLFLLLGMLVRLGVLSEEHMDLRQAQEAARRTTQALRPEVPEAENLAKRLARSIQGKLPVVYGGGILAEVARRWKGQLNENSKHWAFFEQFPELNHNAVMGCQFPRELCKDIVVVTLSSRLNHSRILVRERVTRELFQRAGARCEVVEATGPDALSHMVCSIVQGDFLSYYLALLNGTDPTSIDAIDYLKARLAEV